MPGRNTGQFIQLTVQGYCTRDCEVREAGAVAAVHTEVGAFL